VSVADRLPSRRAFEARLDALVRANRFTIAVVFPLNGAVLLVASHEGWLPEPLAFNPALILLGTLVMRSPLFAGVAPVLDRRSAVGVGLLAAYAYAIEYVGVHTGWPYGEFSYGVDLGPVVAGVPIGLPVFFLPLVMNAYLLTLLLLRERARAAAVRLPAVIGTVLAMDVVLDPGATALGFWSYADPTAGIGSLAAGFHGVPLSNYAGWVLSATMTVVVLDRAFDRTRLVRRLRGCEFMLDDVVSFVLLWGGINLWFGHAVPVAVAALFGLGLLRADRFDARLLRVG
jgi:putative membrane protein